MGVPGGAFPPLRLGHRRPPKPRGFLNSRDERRARGFLSPVAEFGSSRKDRSAALPGDVEQRSHPGTGGGKTRDRSSSMASNGGMRARPDASNAPASTQRFDWPSRRSVSSVPADGSASQ